VTGRTISVYAQWALHGKVLDDEGYQVIACSNGDLSKANFGDALSRFTLGALDMLPQVSVSYLQPAAPSPGGGYLALAIHWFAADGQRHADGVLRFDNQGRPTAFTSYFCAPYVQLAPHGVTYPDMYRGFSAVTLPGTDGLPAEVTITAAAQQVPGIDDLAMRVAPLLLTGVPVCVLGADATSMEERLRFIDTVMGLLPYGFRARMTAATWTRATNRNHRFRLFFSSAPRASEKPDHVVYWDKPELVAPPGGDAGHYYGWLTDKVTPLATLTRLNAEISFGDSAGTEALRLVDEIRLWRRPRPRPPAPDSPGRRGTPGSQSKAAPESADPVEMLLCECDEHVRAPNLSRLRQDLSLLQDRLQSGGIDDSRRRRYRSLVNRFGLLGPDQRLGKYEGKLLDTLIALAFGSPVSYAVLCQLEDSVRGTPGHLPRTAPDPGLPRPLLEALERTGLADVRSKVIVYSHLDGRKLSRWLSSKEVDAYRLIGELARRGWHRKAHGRLFCDATLKYLQDKRGRYATAEIRRALLRNGYLAQALREIGHDQYQVHALTSLLVAAFPEEHYPRGIGDAAITEILAGTPDAPTPALLAAILRKIPAAAAHQAWDAYTYGSIARMGLDEATHGALRTHLPVLAAADETEPPEPPPAPGPRPPQALEPGRGLRLETSDGT